MAKITFGNVPVDMRLTNETFGIDAAQSAYDILNNFNPDEEDIEILVKKSNYLALRAYDDPNYIDVYLWITGQSSYSLSLSKMALKIEASGFYVDLSGDFDVKLSGNFSGTLTGFTYKNVDNGFVYVNATGFDLDFSGNINTYSFDPIPTVDAGLIGDDYLIGGSYSDYLIGYSGNDTLNGSGGNDTLVGGAGNDTLNGGPGKDTMFGESGNDLYYVDNSGDKVYETTTSTSTIDSGGVDTVHSSLAAYTLGRYVENGRIMSTGTANLTGNDLSNTLTGGAGSNTLLGLAGNDTLLGGAGNDTLNGGLGVDTMFGGSGNDLYYVDNSGDKVYETTTSTSTINSGGVDTVYSSLAAYTLGRYVENGRIMSTGTANLTGNDLKNTLTGGAESNKLLGLAGNDTLLGGAGNDTLNGGLGGDTMFGESGNDLYFVDNSGDRVYETTTSTSTIDSGGVDTVHSSLAAYTLGRYVENGRIMSTGTANLTGNGLSNTLTGGAGSNTLLGLAGNDTLLGGAGNDILNGGLGKDTLSGDAGNDIFDFNALSEMGLTSSTRDVITDFTRGQDRIDLSTLDANTATTTNDAFKTLISSSATFTAAGQLKFSDGVLYGNTDADSTAEFAIALTGVTTLETTDVIL
jgi:Ca2+-binding RTX toxin-like protein